MSTQRYLASGQPGEHSIIMITVIFWLGLLYYWIGLFRRSGREVFKWNGSSICRCWWLPHRFKNQSHQLDDGCGDLPDTWWCQVCLDLFGLRNKQQRCCLSKRPPPLPYSLYFAQGSPHQPWFVMLRQKVSNYSCSCCSLESKSSWWWWWWW